MVSKKERRVSKKTQVKGKGTLQKKASKKSHSQIINFEENEKRIYFKKSKRVETYQYIVQHPKIQLPINESRETRIPR